MIYSFPNRGARGEDEESNRVHVLPGQSAVVAFAADDNTARALRGGLAELGDTVEIRRGDIETAIKAYARAKPPGALIVDLGETADWRDALDRLAAVCPPDVRVFCIGTNRELTFYRQLRQDFHVSEYLAKPVNRDAVYRLLLPCFGARSIPTAGRGGHMVAVCGARGGIGTSSMALNLAFELKNAVDGDVALVDMHLQTGELALMLDCPPTTALREALAGDGPVGRDFVSRIAVPLEPRLHLIAAEGEWDPTSQVNAMTLRAFLQTLRQIYSFIVMDIPMPLPDPMQPILDACRHVVTVFTPDISCLRGTRLIGQQVSAVAGHDRVVTLLNRADMPGAIDMAMITEVLGAKPDLTIPELGDSMLDAINRAIPAVRREPALRQYLAPLVSEIAGAAAADTAPRPAGRKMTAILAALGAQLRGYGIGHRNIAATG